MSTTPRTLEGLAEEERFFSQLELVRKHWAAVRRLWLNDSDLDPDGHIRSQLPPEFWIGAGMPGLATIRPIRGGRFEFAEDGRPAIIVPCYDGLPFILDANPAVMQPQTTSSNTLRRISLSRNRP